MHKLNVTLDGDVYELEGVLYEADVPCVNGTIYMRSAVEMAADCFGAETFRPLTLPFRQSLLVGDIIGEVFQVECIDGVLRIVARTLPRAKEVFEAFLVASNNEVSFSGLGVGSHITDDDDRRVTEFVIKYVGVVPWTP